MLMFTKRDSHCFREASFYAANFSRSNIGCLKHIYVTRRTYECVLFKRPSFLCMQYSWWTPILQCLWFTWCTAFWTSVDYYPPLKPKHNSQWPCTKTWKLQSHNEASFHHLNQGSALLAKALHMAILNFFVKFIFVELLTFAPSMMHVLSCDLLIQQVWWIHLVSTVWLSLQQVTSVNYWIEIDGAVYGSSEGTASPDQDLRLVPQLGPSLPPKFSSLPPVPGIPQTPLLYNPGGPLIPVESYPGGPLLSVPNTMPGEIIPRQWHTLLTGKETPTRSLILSCTHCYVIGGSCRNVKRQSCAQMRYRMHGELPNTVLAKKKHWNIAPDIVNNLINSSNVSGVHGRQSTSPSKFDL